LVFIGELMGFIFTAFVLYDLPLRIIIVLVFILSIMAFGIANPTHRYIIYR